jgi:glycogen debranching enzyme
VAVVILDGSTFCVRDERGDIDGRVAAAGFFAADTRFLSRLLLTVDGARPELVSHVETAPHLGSFELRAGDLALRRGVFVGPGIEERIRVENEGAQRVEATVALELAADFADIFAVKRVEDLGAPGDELDPVHAHCSSPAPGTVAFADDEFPARTVVHLLPAAPDGGCATPTYRLALDPGGSWELLVTVQPLLADEPELPAQEFRRALAGAREEVTDSLAAWHRAAPRASSGRPELARTWDRSIEDLAALRMRWPGAGMIPAAGLPWFMTVFGRDTLITSLQTLVLGPELAASALRVLAATQATEDGPELDAEPGKIVHEIRRGKTAHAWTERYYGSVDSTPLFLVLLSEVWRWTRDDALVRELEQPARRALAWIDGPGDRDGDGFVEYSRRASHGIDNQSWKDSHVSMVFRDGSHARPPIAPVEVQGYVYDAKLRTAELAREVWDDAAAAERLEAEAAALRERFDAAFWLPERGFYALALDREKRPLDALASNMGHLLWSGIVPSERVADVAEALTTPPLWSGWGIRTLAADEAAFDPLEYHNGTVWPHDNSLAAAGLARAGRPREAELVVRAVLESAAAFDHRLPELFAGFARVDGEPPAEFPTAARPQAWAAGAPLLLVQALLGVEPDPASRSLRATAEGLRDWACGLVLDGVHAFGRRWRVAVEDGAAVVEAAGDLAAERAR